MTCCQWAIVRFCHLCAHSSQQGLLWGSIGMVTKGQEPVVDGSSTSPHSTQLPHLCCQGPILSDHLQQSTAMTRWVPVAACLWRMRLMVAWVRPTRPAISLCCMSSQASVSTQGCQGQGKSEKFQSFSESGKCQRMPLQVREFCNLLSKSGKSQGISFLAFIDAHLNRLTNDIRTGTQLNLIYDQNSTI